MGHYVGIQSGDLSLLLIITTIILNRQEIMASIFHRIPLIMCLGTNENSWKLFILRELLFWGFRVFQKCSKLCWQIIQIRFSNKKNCTQYIFHSDSLNYNYVEFNSAQESMQSWFVKTGRNHLFIQIPCFMQKKYITSVIFGKMSLIYCTQTCNHFSFYDKGNVCLCKAMLSTWLTVSYHRINLWKKTFIGEIIQESGVNHGIQVFVR